VPRVVVPSEADSCDTAGRDIHHPCRDPLYHEEIRAQLSIGLVYEALTGPDRVMELHSLADSPFLCMLGVSKAELCTYPSK
jgi:hypothetical protein